MSIFDYETHCEYCMCPKEIFTDNNLKTYSGDRCKLYYYFSEVIDEFESKIIPFTAKDIYKKCETELTKHITDIPDLKATVDELLEINDIELGVMPSNYKSKTTKQRNYLRVVK